MKKAGCVFLAFAAAYAASAQNIVSSYSADGSVTVSTTSTQYIWSSVGGPRGSHNHAWVGFLKQSTSNSQAVPFGGSTSSISSFGTYYPPTYQGLAGASNSFTNSPTQAMFSGSYRGALAFNTVLPAHALARANTAYSQYFTFSIPTDSNLTINASGDPSIWIFVEDITTHAYIYYGGVTTNQTFTLQGGDAYQIHVTAGGYAYSNTQTGTSYNVGKTNLKIAYQFTVSPPSDSGGGD